MLRLLDFESPLGFVMRERLFHIAAAGCAEMCNLLRRWSR